MILLFPFLIVSVLATHPLTLSTPREWHVSPTDPPGTKITHLKLSIDSAGATNVTFGLEPSFHRDFSKYFRIDEKTGEVFLKEVIREKGPGFLQVTVKAEEAVGSRVEVRVNIGTGATTPLTPYFRPTFPTITKTTTNSTESTISTQSKEVTEPTTITTIATTIATETSSNENEYIAGVIVVGTAIIFIFLFIIVLKKRSSNKRVITKEISRKQNDYTSSSPSAPISPHSIPRHLILIKSLLGQGCFGQVYLCEYEGNTYAVKTLKESAGEREREDLLSELEVLKKIDSHPNVVKLIGSCCEGDQPPLLILEYLALGPLHTYLRKSRTSSHYDNLHSSSTLSSQTLTSYALQVAKGMDFLTKKGIVHRDLAARNVLLDGDGSTCKVADFGFARGLNCENVYEKKSGDGRLPIRWLPPESLYFSLFSSASDVWAFGVLLWEISTLGSTPYPGMSPGQVMNKVKDGYRLEKPPHCKREFYNVMFYCWNERPEERPRFEDLVGVLEGLVEGGGDYLRLDLFPEHCYVNLDFQVGDEDERV